MANPSERVGSGEPVIIAHRGFAGVNPENTIAAAQATSKEADAIELDVMACAEGEVVVFHDHRLDARDGSRGITDGSGVVWETPCKEVVAAEVLDSGETVPRLAEFLAAVPPDTWLNVELKHPGAEPLCFAKRLDGDDLSRGQDRWRPFVASILAELDNFEHDVLISSFYEAALAVVRELVPTVPIGVLVWDSLERGFDVAADYEAEAIHPPLAALLDRGDECASSPGFSTSLEGVEIVSRAHDEGRAVNVWTVKRSAHARRLRDIGVDGLIADYPGLLDEEKKRLD